MRDCGAGFGVEIAQRAGGFPIDRPKTRSSPWRMKVEAS
eukprot:COSAG02_NODE_58096_length_278_cov_0.944134_1_plen_38_part_10